MNLRGVNIPIGIWIKRSELGKIRWLCSAEGDEDKSDEEEDELTPVAKSSMHVELGDSSKQVEPKAGTGDMAGDAGIKGHVEPLVS